MILVSWLQTQTLAKCSSMRNPLPLASRTTTPGMLSVFSAHSTSSACASRAFSAQYPSHTLMDAALLQTLLQAFVHREKVQTVDAALEQDIQLMLQIFFGKIS